MTSDYSSYDAALTALRPYGTELSNGFTLHAPMVAEALSALGRADAVLPWLDSQRATFIVRDAVDQPIDAASWREAVGTRTRFADWSVFFEQEIARTSWQQVVGEWLPCFLPAACSDATHGLIRCGHAVRAISAVETPARRTEVADALASWADTFQTLPRAENPSNSYPLKDVLEHVSSKPPAQRETSGSIVTDLMQLDDYPEFADVWHLPELESGMTAEDAQRHLLVLAELFARVAAANALSFSGAIVFVHSVTALLALSRLLAFVPAHLYADAVRYGWQASAALYTIYGLRAPAPEESVVTVPVAAQLERAVASGDDHAIKFAEACLSLEAATSSPAFGVALERVLGFLAPDVAAPDNKAT